MGSSNITISTPTQADAEAIAAGAGAVVGKDEAVVQGGQNTKNVIGSDASSSGVVNNGGLAIGGQNNNLTGAQVTVGYDAGQFQTALQTVGSNLSEALNAQGDAGKQTLDSVLTKLSDLAESKQTDGESGKNKIVLYVVAGVLALLAFLFYRK